MDKTNNANDSIKQSAAVSIEQGNRVKQLRNITHLSRRAFALKHDLSPGTLQNCEDGRYKKLTQKTALALIRAFQVEGIECHLEWLIYGTGIQPLHPFNTHIDSEKSHAELIQETLKNQKRHKLNSMLFAAASEGRYFEVIRLVEMGVDIHLNEGLNIKAYNRNHNTPLHLAALNGHGKILKYLIKNGSNVNSKNKKNETPLHLAVHNAHLKIIKLLVSSKARVDELDCEGDTPLAWAAYKGQLDALLELLKFTSHINTKNHVGNTPLHWAAEAGYADIVRILLKNGANCIERNIKNELALHVAVNRGELDVLKIFLEES